MASNHTYYIMVITVAREDLVIGFVLKIIKPLF